MSEDVLGYLERKGLNPKRAGGYEFHLACPFCGEDPGKRGRMYVNTDPEAAIPGLFHCKICDERGALVSLKRHFGDQVQQAEEDYGLLREILADAAAYYHDQLGNNDQALTWLRERRGLTVETIVDRQLGWADGRLQAHLRTKGYKLSDMIKTGLVTEGARLLDSLNDMVTIPYQVAGNVVMIRGRLFPYKGDGYPDERDGSKYKTPSGQSSRLFNSDAVWGVDEIVVAEGEFDAIILAQHGFAAIAVPGANTWQASWDGYITDLRRAFLALDNDAAGNQGTGKLMERLGKRARPLDLPIGVDVTAYFVSGNTTSDFQALIDAARGSGLLITVDEAAAEHALIQGMPGLKLGIEELDLMLNPGLLAAQVMIILAKAGTGKGHPLDAEVPTPSGIRRWGDLRVGDQVFGSDGYPVGIVSIHERGVLPTYKVTFSDKVSVLVDRDHIWSVRFRYGKRREWISKSMSTAELLASDLRRGAEFRYSIPMADPVIQPEADLPVEPYTLGALIANGSMLGTTAVLTTPDDEVVDRVRQRYSVHRIQDATEVCPRFVVHKTIGLVKALGLNVHSHEKFIPEQYFNASVGQRIALLQGLLDADGSRQKRRSVRYFTSSPQLALDVERLVTSLGGTAMSRWSQRAENRPEGVISIMVPLGIEPFSTSRKRVSAGRLRRVPYRAIVSITQVDDQPIRCITVDAHDSLYLIGREHVVTHNTLFLLNLFELLSLAQPDAKILFVSLEQTRGEWFERARRIYRFYRPDATDAQCLDFWRDRLLLVDKNRFSEDELRSVLDEFKDRMGTYPALTALDYLGYFAQGFKGDRYERTSDAVMSLKAVGKDHQMPIISPHQVSRVAKYGQEPDADAARDAGVVEETADFLFTLWSQDHALGKDDDDKTGEVLLRVGKSRHGGRGTKVTFQFAPLTLAMVPLVGAQPVHVARARDELVYVRNHDDWETALRRHRREIAYGETLNPNVMDTARGARTLPKERNKQTDLKLLKS